MTAASQHDDQNRFRRRLMAPILLIALIWLVSFVFLSGAIRWPGLGVMPRELHGLWGILWMPFLHGSVAHLVSNTMGLLVLGLLISTRGRGYFWAITASISMLTGVGVWIIGQSGVHIGASGLVFGFFGFLVVRGFYDERLSSLLVALAVLVFYGGIIWGVLPTDGRVSWEAHLCGLIAGSFIARLLHGRSPTTSRLRRSTETGRAGRRR